MYNIYISYPYNMLTILSKVTDVFKDYNFKLMKSNLISSNVSEECVADKEFINFNDTY